MRHLSFDLYTLCVQEVNAGYVLPINAQQLDENQTDLQHYGKNSAITGSGIEAGHLHMTLAEIDQFANEDVVMQVGKRAFLLILSLG